LSPLSPSSSCKLVRLLVPPLLLHVAAADSLPLLPLALFYRIIRQLVNETRRKVLLKQGKDVSHITDVVPEGSNDPAPPAEMVATRTWMIGATISVILTMVLGHTEVCLRLLFVSDALVQLADASLVPSCPSVRPQPGSLVPRPPSRIHVRLRWSQRFRNDRHEPGRCHRQGRSAHHRRCDQRTRHLRPARPANVPRRRIHCRTVGVSLGRHGW
jgi:hypothetical protein